MSSTANWVVVDAEFSDRINRYGAMDQQSNYEMIGRWITSALRDGAIKVTMVRTERKIVLE